MSVRDFKIRKPGPHDPRNAAAIGKAAQEDMLRRIQSGEIPVLDRMQRPVLKGHLILWEPQYLPVWEVEDVKPILDPRMGPGQVQLTLTCRFPMPVPAGVPLPAYTIVGALPETPAGVAAGATAESSDEAPPEDGSTPQGVVNQPAGEAPAPTQEGDPSDDAGQ